MKTKRERKLDKKFESLKNIMQLLGYSGTLRVEQPEEKEDYFIKVVRNGEVNILGYSHPDMDRCIENGILYFQKQYKELKELGLY